jgi:hypothetical protein
MTCNPVVVGPLQGADLHLAIRTGLTRETLLQVPANMVEIDTGVLRGQCLGRRIADRDHLVEEIAA